MQEARKLVTLDTVLDKVIYENVGFAVFGTKERYSVSGAVLDAAESLINTPILLTGYWDTYNGRPSFRFSTYQLQENQMFFFLTKMVGGISAAVAKKIVATYSEDALADLMDNSPTTLLSFKGIGAKRLEKIKHRWAAFAGVRKLGKLLLPLGVTNNMILRIHEHFGAAGPDIITGDTYRLTEVRGIGFKIADSVALRMGIDPHDPKRLAACVYYCLREKMAGAGNTAIAMSALVEIVMEEIKVDQVAELACGENEIVEAIGSLLESSGPLSIKLVQGNYPEKDCRLTLHYLYKYETFILNTLREAASVEMGQVAPDIDAWIAKYEKRHGRALGALQKTAVRMANARPQAFSVSGYAGTGKTATSNAILELLALTYTPKDIVCCALSGIAANRVKTQSGYPAFTIHSLLSFRNGVWTFNAENPLPHKIILLDEASMVGSEMMYRLMSAIDFDHGAMLILLGDPAQLPPVDAGAPFANMLSLGLVHNVTLDKIYRQSEDKVITTFAADVRNGRVPAGVMNDYADFRFVEETVDNYFSMRKTLSKEEMLEVREECNLRIQKAIANEAYGWRAAMHDLYVKKNIWGYLTHFQVLTPIKKGSVGAIELNAVLQETINPDSGLPFIKVGTRILRERDKVVHLRNKDMEVAPMGQYRDFLDGKDGATEVKRVFNGQLGAVVKVDEEANEVHVVYPNEGYVVVYGKIDISNEVVDLAYALSVHKTQGSEFAHVVAPMTISHYSMLDPNLIYTGMTRAKDSLTLIGQKFAFEAGCRRTVEAKRETCIERLVHGPYVKQEAVAA